MKISVEISGHPTKCAYYEKDGELTECPQRRHIYYSQDIRM